jgi:hypothetical protein
MFCLKIAREENTSSKCKGDIGIDLGDTGCERDTTRSDSGPTEGFGIHENVASGSKRRRAIFKREPTDGCDISATFRGLRPFCR